MNKNLLLIASFILMIFTLSAKPQENKSYNNFKVAVYARAYEVQKMNNLNWLDSIWSEISGQVKVDKIYLETHRDLILVDDKTIEMAKEYFNSRGIKTAGLNSDWRK
ncbi:MAG TPA: hypothetical protein VMV77_14540 [Bacteroidales bacterium]|nr:hypothetical protein [Bacteroidales bacterium]